MGYIRHDAVLVATEDYRPGGLPDIDDFRASLPEPWRRLVIGPVEGVVNGTLFYAFLPDGSKEGWLDSDLGDAYREEFRQLFRFAHDDGSSCDDVVTVAFGGDHGPEVGASVETNWPPNAMVGFIDPDQCTDHAIEAWVNESKQHIVYPGPSTKETK